MTDDDVISHGVVAEPVTDEQSLQTPENREEEEEEDDEDEDTDTDDGAVGDDADIDGILILVSCCYLVFQKKELDSWIWWWWDDNLMKWNDR